MSNNHRHPRLGSSCDGPPHPHDLAAVQLSCSWFNLHRSISAEQHFQTAKAFAADPRTLRLNKIILDSDHLALRAVSSIRRRILGYWKGITLPLPGSTDVRLMQQADVDAFVVQMASLQAELDDALTYLQACQHELQEQARSQLGDLYQSSDYPHSLAALYEVAWDWPRMPLPGYLTRVSPGTVSDQPSPHSTLGEDDVNW